VETSEKERKRSLRNPGKEVREPEGELLEEVQPICPKGCRHGESSHERNIWNVSKRGRHNFDQPAKWLSHKNSEGAVMLWHISRKKQQRGEGKRGGRKLEAALEKEASAQIYVKTCVRKKRRHSAES